MSFADERRAIEARFAANFSTLPVAYENVPFAQPASGGFVRLTIRPAGARQASTGSSPLQRYAGLIVADIFVPENTGTATARAHADTVEAIFRQAQFSAGNSGTITCRTPSIEAVGVRDGWFQLSVSVPYQRDRIF
jgi:hypothetical protein